MKATKATWLARVQDLHRLRGDGAAWADIRHYVAEQQAQGVQPWALPPGGKPLSERQLRRYIAAADQLLAVEFRTQRQKRRLLHLARREKLFTRALEGGDLGTALAALKDLAKLEGLYPSPDDPLLRRLGQVSRQLGALQGGGKTHGECRTPPPGPPAAPAGEAGPGAGP
jgi:hypothetical protein